MPPAPPELPHGAAASREQRDRARAAIYASPELGRHRLAQVVALRIADAINNTSGWTFISQDRLAADLGIRKLSIQRALASLTGNGVTGNRHMPALSRPYFYRQSVPIGNGGRSMIYHCLAAVDASTVEPRRAGPWTGDGRDGGTKSVHGGTTTGGTVDARQAGRSRLELGNSLTVREARQPSDAASAATDSATAASAAAPPTSDGAIVIKMRRPTWRPSA